MKFKEFIGAVLFFGGIIGMVICAIASGIFYFQNPDMTDLRRLIEYPEPTIWMVVCFVCEWIGVKMLGG